MQKFFKTDLFILLILFVLFMLILPFFYMHQGIFTVDIGRELYISQQVSSGGVLYKDIFNIYGPFSYQLNGLLLLIFGDKISTLYNTGIINSLIIISSLYLLAREFIRKSYSILITVLFMFSLCFTTFLFNSNITYSYGLIYALSTFLVSLLFLIKYTKTEKLHYIYLSSLFAGLSILNKYEFVLYPLVILYVITFLKPVNKKTILKTVLIFFIFPAVSFLILFIQGLRIQELIHAFKLMIIMAGSGSMRIFYSTYGNFFELNSYLRLITKNPILTVIGFIPVINIVLFCAFFKNIKQNIPLFVFCLSVILAAFKFTLYLNIEHMGVFIFPLCFLMLFFICEKIKSIDNIKYLILVSLILFFAYSDFNSLKEKTNLLETPKGDIYTYYQDKVMMQTAIDYAFKNIFDYEKVVILPEGAFVNYITGKKSDNIFHNLVPLYYKDTFGEEAVLKHFNEFPADYFIILPLSTGEYGSPNFCVYAKNFCEMIEDKYILDLEENNIKIYKRK